MITKDVMRQMCVPLENHVHFGDRHSVDFEPCIET